MIWLRQLEETVFEFIDVVEFFYTFTHFFNQFFLFIKIGRLVLGRFVFVNGD